MSILASFYQVLGQSKQSEQMYVDYIKTIEHDYPDKREHAYFMVGVYYYEIE